MHVGASLATWRPTTVCKCNMCRFIYVYPYVCIQLQVCLSIERESVLLLHPMIVHVICVAVRRYST